MRLQVRIALIIVACLLLLAGYGFSKIRKRGRAEHDSKTDETVRILLMSEDPSSANLEANMDVTFNVVVVLVVSLLSIALIITGIIVVAITLDPSMTGNGNGEDDDEEDGDVFDLELERAVVDYEILKNKLII